MNLFRSIKRAFKLEVLLGSSVFLLFPFFHHHPANSHPHHRYEVQHRHVGHYHSHEVEAVTKFIDIRPFKSKGKSNSYSRNVLKYETDQDNFESKKYQTPKLKIHFTHYSTFSVTAIISPKSSGDPVMPGRNKKLSTCHFPDSVLVRGPPLIET